MQHHNPEKNFVTAHKVNASLGRYEDAIARINARLAAARAAKLEDSAYGSTPSSPALSAVPDSSASSGASEETLTDLTQTVDEDVEASTQSAVGLEGAESEIPESDGSVVVSSEHYQAYIDQHKEYRRYHEWFQDQSVVAELESAEEHGHDEEKLEDTKQDHDYLVPSGEENVFLFREQQGARFTTITQPLEENIVSDDVYHDSGVELTPPHSDDEDEIVDVPLHQELPKPQVEYLAHVSLAVSRDIYEKDFIKPATSIVPARKACAFGKCTAACLVSPCYPVDHLLDEYRATRDEFNPKTTRIYLDISGKASLISYPRSKALRLLAQELNEDVTMDIVDIQELDNEHAKYRFEIDISKFVRSSNVLVYSTSPITAFYRNLEDETDEFDPFERAQHELTSGHGIAVHVPNLFLGTKAEFEEFAQERAFSRDQQNVVVFHGECEDHLNQLDDFGEVAPMHNDMEEISEYTREERIARKEKARVFEECCKFAHASAIPEVKDAVVLFCAENGVVLNFEQVYRRTREEDMMDCEAGVHSLSGFDLLQKTVEPEDKDQVVQRVVAWLEKDDGGYERTNTMLEEDRDITSNPNILANNKQENRLSPFLLAKYEELIASIEPTLQASATLPEAIQTETTHEFTLIKSTEANAEKQKKHIFLSTTDKDTSIHFAPPTQNLTIKGPTITTCHEIDPLAIPSSIQGTTVHALNFPQGNCVIYSTQSLATYTLDFSLPEVKDAPRGNRQQLKTYLRKHCLEYKEWAPYAEKFKMNLGMLGAKEVKSWEMVLGQGEKRDGE